MAMAAPLPMVARQGVSVGSLVDFQPAALVPARRTGVGCGDGKRPLPPPTRAAVFDRCQRPNFAPLVCLASLVCLVVGDGISRQPLHKRKNFSTRHIQTVEASRRTPAAADLWGVPFPALPSLPAVSDGR